MTEPATKIRHSREALRERRRLRFRRHSRRAYIRSIYALPSLATLGNAICGFAAMYVSTLDATNVGNDPITQYFATYRFAAAAYLVCLAMIFDALDGRLARFARHTTDFGGQLDSLCDAISFGVAPAFIMIQLIKTNHPALPPLLSRFIWAIAALYMSCAIIRLARFNVSNEHGEQHHFSFLGLPSPGAAGAVISIILLHHHLYSFHTLQSIVLWTVPAMTLLSGLLMVSAIRYPHIVNRYLRGKRSLGRVVFVLSLILGLIVAHWLVFAVGMLTYVILGLFGPLMAILKPAQTPPAQH